MAYPDSWRTWPPDPAIIDGAVRGEDGSVEVLIVAGLPKLIAFYRGMGVAPHDAEDLAADAALAVVRNIGRLRDKDRFEAWFWRVGRSKFYDHLRRKQKPVPSPEREVDYYEPIEAVISSEDHADVRAAFESLSRRDRELLWLREVIGLEYSEISARLPLAEGAIRIAVMRARRRLEAAYLVEHETQTLGAEGQ